MISSRISFIRNFISPSNKSFFHNYSSLFPSVSFYIHRFSAAAAAAADTATGEESPPPHPWPEWVIFVDRLKTKGYFPKQSSSAENDEIIYREANLIKDACLRFARDRYDLIKLLSSRDIQTLMERGCPNLLRKSVNSSKRLRAHVHLEEKDVCSTCDLRGSCDRAYTKLKGSDIDARTVDIIRVLMSYAIDPLMISEGERPIGKEIVHESASRLLLELVELSDKFSNTPPPQPATRKSRLNSAEDKDMQESSEVTQENPNLKPKNGDWICPKCKYINFAKNDACRECKEVPDKLSVMINIKKGDWLCSECNFLNFAINQFCKKCKTEGPARVSVEIPQMRTGDWNCPGCGFMNFADNKQCIRCRVQRPKRELNGDWECPSCDFVNFSRNTVCRRCTHDRPHEVTSQI